MSAVVSSSAGECGSNVDNSSSCRLRTIAGTVISVRTPSTSSNNSNNNNNNNNIGPSRLRDRRDSTLSATNRIGTTTNTATAVTNNSSTPNTNSTKQCCFHWCCCCRCSCLAVKAVEEAKSESARPEVMKLFDDDKLPTLEEVQLWGESFDRLMKSEGGRRVFREFLRGEYSEENILFWLACEELKKETNPSVVEERARFIYEDYISILSPKEVSLDSRVRELVNRNMVEPKADMFEEAQTQIYTLMHRDSYPRFVNSQVYKDLLQSVSSVTPSTSSAKPSNNARKKNVS